MCGIGGVWGPGAVEAAAEMAKWLMHRGEEGVGYAYLSKDGVKVGAPAGEVEAAVVHTRYSTSGPYGVQIQPVLAKYRDLEAAVAFNGTVVNYKVLDPGAAADAEALAKKFVELVWEHGLAEGLRALYEAIEGAASIIALTQEALIAVRDIRGIRPLAYAGRAAASESIALEGASSEIPPGYAVVIKGGGAELVKYGEGVERLCALEYVYFAHPASRLGGRRVAEVRRALGAALAKREEVRVDAAAYVPETAETAAEAYAEALGKPLAEAIMKNRYAGRIFIKPPDKREPKAAFKVDAEAVAGKSIAVVDDSLIRGTNLGSLVKALRAAGARGVHLRIASPPIRWPCYYGMDFQTPEELAARGKTEGELAREIGADSLKYLPLEDFRTILGPNICYACFTGEYPLQDLGGAASPSRPGPRRG
ncbi:MAG: amidophosphoribosyltransferase [Thermoproteus sp. AZ2]|jgi:amidophosphoribosyltransferase|uniref:Amidophosphoribosyltransferase n=1 Tax=Thermoproteus sp. AZ2 TaxID=1609232 RepID=A0ACC6V2Q3_9CREN